MTRSPCAVEGLTGELPPDPRPRTDRPRPYTPSLPPDHPPNTHGTLGHRRPAQYPTTLGPTSEKGHRRRIRGSSRTRRARRASRKSNVEETDFSRHGTRSPSCARNGGSSSGSSESNRACTPRTRRARRSSTRVKSGRRSPYLR